jgi:hypothetical protein
MTHAHVGNPRFITASRHGKFWGCDAAAADRGQKRSTDRKNVSEILASSRTSHIVAEILASSQKSSHRRGIKAWNVLGL